MTKIDGQQWVHERRRLSKLRSARYAWRKLCAIYRGYKCWSLEIPIEITS